MGELTMFAHKRAYILSSIIIAVVAVTAVFQNCSEVHFETTDELLKAGIDGSLRQVSFSPKFAENRPDIDVTTILDNSNSMSQIQSNVKNAVSSTTTSLKGFSGSLKLYTTTQDLTHAARNRNTSYYFKIEDENGDLVPSTSFTSSDLTGYKAEVDNMGAPLYSSYEEWTSYINYSPFKVLSFEKSMSDSDFSKFQNDVFNEIQMVDTSGSTVEVGLCSLLRNIDSYKESSSFHTYIIATNEDDSSTVQNCIKEESKRWDRTPVSVDGGTTSCLDSDPACSFSYTVSYKAPKKFKYQYKYSYVESQKISYSLKSDSKLKSETRKVSYSTTKRYAKHKLKQNSWKIKYKRNVVIGDNDGIPIKQIQSFEQDQSGRGTNYGACSSGSTTYAACSGTDLTYFNNSIASLYTDEVAGSCEVICQNKTTSDLFDYYDASAIPTSTTVSYPSAITGATLTGYITGCQAWVATKKNYAALNITSEMFDSCSLGYDTLGTVSNDIYIGKSLGTCAASSASCSAAEKSAAITTSNYGSVDSSLISCNNNCSTADLNSNVDSSSVSNRISGAQLCSGKNIGDGDAEVKLTCNTAELNLAITKLNTSLSTNGLTGTTLTGTQVNCEYICKHKNTDFRDHGSESTINPWANESTGNLACTDTIFSSVTYSNLFGCRKYVYDGTQPATKTFVSTDGAICTGAYTLASIMAHPDAVSKVVDNGAASPMSSCLVSGGTKDAPDTIQYNWALTNKPPVSLIGEDGLTQTLANKLKEAHGNNYYIAAFINDPDQENELCKNVNLADFYGPSNSLQYEGLKFKELASALGSGKMKTFPACMPDYTQAMKFVFDLIVTSAKRSYKLELDEAAQEWVYRVKMLDSHGLVHNLSSDQFSWDKGLITFDESVDLDAAEMLYVDVVVPNPLSLVDQASEEDKK
jgi:hypothetical protein